MTAGYEGDWVHPDEDDVRRGKSGEPVDHHRYWNQALHNTVQKVPKGEKGPFAVHRYVTVDHENPGWVDGYRIDLGG